MEDVSRIKIFYDNVIYVYVYDYVHFYDIVFYYHCKNRIHEPNFCLRRLGVWLHEFMPAPCDSLSTKA